MYTVDRADYRPYPLPMKRTLLLLVVIGIVVLAPLSADTGLGVIVGDPTGVSVLLANRIAVAAAWSLDSRLHLHADLWLINRPLVTPLNWYLGAGGKVTLVSGGNGEGNDDSVSVGGRVPIGVQWYVLPRLELFAEIAPGLQIIPETGFDIDGGIGARFHF